MHNSNFLINFASQIKTDMVAAERIQNKDNYVYDISLDGTVVNALGGNVASNTDGFNFQEPPVYRYTEDNPYISDGRGRNTKEGKAYSGIYADIAEFEDRFLSETRNNGVLKMGLGLDEVVDASINFSRKNYADLMPNGKIKMVGNTIKSKKMPAYIEKFLDKAINMLLHCQGEEFLNYYQDYIDQIYNMRIPLRDIASVGKIKQSIDDYKIACKTLTKSGSKKSRQAWYELAIQHNMTDVKMGDAIYYINTGDKASDSDVKRTTEYFYIDEDGQRRYTTTTERGREMKVSNFIKSRYDKKKKEDPTFKTRYPKLEDFGKTLFPTLDSEDVLDFKCVMLPNDIIEDEDDHFCDENLTYNRAKYIKMFNNRIRPLLVCFDKNVRTTTDAKGKEVDYILIDNPKDRHYFTKEQCQLVSGQPFNPTDQDTYEQLMSMEDKEIKFWLSIGKKPIFADECGMNWDEIVADYNKRMEEREREEIKAEVEEYEKLIDALTEEDVEHFIETGELPDGFTKLVHLSNTTNEFMSNKYDVSLGNIFDVLDKDFTKDEPDE